MDKHLFITGGSRGLGRAIAERFSSEGARVTITGRTEEDLQRVSNELGEMVAYQVCDITNREQTWSALERARAHHGRVDILVNNAGIGAYKPFLERSVEELEQEVAVNVTALIRITRWVTEAMRNEGGGQVINIASDVGRQPIANMAVYSGTKHAVVGFSQSLARELKQYGIKCMVLTPGIIDSYFDGREEGMIDEWHALKPKRMAEIVFYLASQPEFILIDELSIHPMKQDF